MGQKNSIQNNQNIIDKNKEKLEIVTKTSFEYISVIGKGGFGKVWKVYQKNTKHFMQ